MKKGILSTLVDLKDLIKGLNNICIQNVISPYIKTVILPTTQSIQVFRIKLTTLSYLVMVRNLTLQNILFVTF